MKADRVLRREFVLDPPAGVAKPNVQPEQLDVPGGETQDVADALVLADLGLAPEAMFERVLGARGFAGIGLRACRMPPRAQLAMSAAWHARRSGDQPLRLRSERALAAFRLRRGNRLLPLDDSRSTIDRLREIFAREVSPWGPE